MLIEYLVQPRAGDIDTPGEGDLSAMWVKEPPPDVDWLKVEDFSG